MSWASTRATWRRLTMEGILYVTRIPRCGPKNHFSGAQLDFTNSGKSWIQSVCLIPDG